MIKCRDFIKSINQSLDDQTAVGWYSKLELRLHRLICVHCNNYFKQLYLIRQGVRRWILSKSVSIPDPKIKEIENQVIDSIKKNKQI